MNRTEPFQRHFNNENIGTYNTCTRTNYKNVTRDLSRL